MNAADAIDAIYATATTQGWKIEEVPNLALRWMETIGSNSRHSAYRVRRLHEV